MFHQCWASPFRLIHCLIRLLDDPGIDASQRGYFGNLLPADLTDPRGNFLPSNPCAGRGGSATGSNRTQARQLENAASVAEVCRKAGITETRMRNRRKRIHVLFQWEGCAANTQRVYRLRKKMGSQFPNKTPK